MAYISGWTEPAGEERTAAAARQLGDIVMGYRNAADSEEDSGNKSTRTPAAVQASLSAVNVTRGDTAALVTFSTGCRWSGLAWTAPLLYTCVICRPGDITPSDF